MKMTGTESELAFADAVARTPPGMASIAGSGPNLKTCHGCKHWEHGTDDADKVYYSRTGKHGGAIKPARCSRYEQLTAGTIGPSVPHWARACKYFDENPSPWPLVKPE